MKYELNPPHGSARYLEALNRCFGGWGGQQEFDWYFNRSVAGRIADRFIIIDDGDEWIAGSGLSWRKLIDGSGRERLVGIMTGSWTLPSARGRGCFKTMIEASRARCTEIGAAWLLAFVTSENASRRSLEAAGALMIPTSYLWSLEGTLPNRSGALQLADRPSGGLEDWWRDHDALRGERAGFFYNDAAEWKSQFVDRPLGTELLEMPGVGRLIVEHHSVFDRVITVIANGEPQRLELEQAAYKRALLSGRRFFTFTSLIEYGAELREKCGLGGIDGYMVLLPAAEAKPEATGFWFVESGDRV